jgi:hypothetical protein
MKHNSTNLSTPSQTFLQRFVRQLDAMFAREIMLACSVVNLQIRSSHGLLIRAALGLGNRRAPNSQLFWQQDKIKLYLTMAYRFCDRN